MTLVLALLLGITTGVVAQQVAPAPVHEPHIITVRDNEPSEFLDAVVVQSSAQMDGYTTYALGVRPKSGADVSTIYTIFGSPSAARMQFPAAFQAAAPFGADIGGTNPLFVTYLPTAACDSWLTVGVTEGNAAMAISTVGIDFTQWSEDQPLTVENGAVFWMHPDAAPKLTHTGGAVQIAQLTIPTATAWRAVVNVQGKNAGAEAGRDWQHHGLVFDNEPYMHMRAMPAVLPTPTGH